MTFSFLFPLPTGVTLNPIALRPKLYTILAFLSARGLKNLLLQEGTPAFMSIHHLFLKGSKRKVTKVVSCCKNGRKT